MKLKSLKILSLLTAITCALPALCSAQNTNIISIRPSEDKLSTSPYLTKYYKEDTLSKTVDNEGKLVIDFCGSKICYQYGEVYLIFGNFSEIGITQLLPGLPLVIYKENDVKYGMPLYKIIDVVDGTKLPVDNIEYVKKAGDGKVMMVDGKEVIRHTWFIKYNDDLYYLGRLMVDVPVDESEFIDGYCYAKVVYDNEINPLYEILPEATESDHLLFDDLSKSISGLHLYYPAPDISMWEECDPICDKINEFYTKTNIIRTGDHDKLFDILKNYTNYGIIGLNNSITLEDIAEYDAKENAVKMYNNYLMLGNILKTDLFREEANRAQHFFENIITWKNIIDVYNLAEMLSERRADEHLLYAHFMRYNSGNVNDLIDAMKKSKVIEANGQRPSADSVKEYLKYIAPVGLKKKKTSRYRGYEFAETVSKSFIDWIDYRDSISSKLPKHLRKSFENQTTNIILKLFDDEFLTTCYLDTYADFSI